MFVSGMFWGRGASLNIKQRGGNKICVNASIQLIRFQTSWEHICDISLKVLPFLAPHLLILSDTHTFPLLHQYHKPLKIKQLSGMAKQRENLWVILFGSPKVMDKF